MVKYIRELVKEQQASSETHRLIFNNNGFDHLLVSGDKERISQVVLNLLTNAIKYSPRADEVNISIDCNKENVIVNIKDKGIGIEKNEIDHLFKKFYRVMGKDETTFPGFGIGLYIVNEILQKHSGKIWLNSEKGKGSEFSFSLPLIK